MKKFFNSLTEDRIILRLVFVFLFAFGITIIYFLLTYFLLPPFLPLYNQLPWGTARIGQKQELLLPLLLVFLMACLNLFLIAREQKNLPLPARILASTTAFIGILLLIFVVRITQLVI